MYDCTIHMVNHTKTVWDISGFFSQNYMNYNWQYFESSYVIISQIMTYMVEVTIENKLVNIYKLSKDIFTFDLDPF